MRTGKLLLAIAAVTGILLYPTQVLSAKIPPKGLALSPIRSEVEVSPGSILKRTLQLTDYSNQAMTVRLNAEEFKVIDQQYDYSFDARSDVSKWVTFEKTVVQLEPGKSETVNFKVSVPKNAEPGGRYLSIFASTDARAAAGELQTEQRIASLVYLTVQGKVTRSGELKSLQGPFIFDGYQPWKITITNSGTVHFRSKYSVSVRSIFDDQEVASKTDDSLILPNTARAIDAPMPALKYLGVYHAVYTVGLGDSPAAIREQYIVFLPRQLYVPLLSLIVIFVGGLLYGGRKIIQRIKRKSVD